ncbi:DNA translocase FtsK [bacterium]|nr:DNA translocase FtsK [bacterium]
MPVSKPKSSSSRSGSSTRKSASSTRKPAAKKTTARKSTAASSRSKAGSPQQHGHSFGRDLLILTSAALAVFMGFAVYYPSFSDPAGPFVNKALHTSIGIGMYVIPLVMVCVPFLFFENKWRPRFLGAWLWSWALSILGALIGGCFTAQDWGGLLGTSAATLGRSYMGNYYAVLVGVISLLVVVRIVGWRPFVSIAKGGVHAGARAVEAAGQFKAQISEEAAILREEREARAKERAERQKERRSKAEQDLINAELEAADAPEDDSPIIRDSTVPAKDEKQVAAKAETELPATGVPEGTVAAASPVEAADEPVQPVDLSVTGLPSLGMAEAGLAAETVRVQDDFMDVVNSAGTHKAAETTQNPDVLARPESSEVSKHQTTEAAVAQETEVPAVVAAAEAALEAVDTALEVTIPAVDESNQKLRELVEDHGGHTEEQQSLFPHSHSDFVLPGVELLKDSLVSGSEEQHLAPRAKIIERTLASFNIDARCSNWVVGPRVTRFEIKIGPGINVNKISNLADNLALELAVKAVRIEAPIPGMSAVGIEVPNASPDLVTLKDILTSSIFRNNNHPLTVGVGRDIAGNPIIANLAKTPHLLVAGATGSGKSVCLNTLIVSLLMRNTPETLRLILIDPKRVEMTSYEDVPQLACPVVCEVNQAQSALKWVVAEMDRRYRLLQAHKARNIATFNDQVERHKRLPFLVVVIDELADLMMLAGKTIEALICRITQLSRAVGIHMVIATQRPDVKVITGLIKANVPSRIAFAVVSNVDSRTILDGGGAEKLLGSGDMLFSPIGENVPLRVQGCFLTDDEINRVTAWCREQAPPRYDEGITQFGDDEEDGAGSTVGAGGGPDDDPLLGEAEQIVRSTGRASTSFLQRKLKIGYNRAARLMEELEFAEVVTPPDHAGNRSVIP